MVKETFFQKHKQELFFWLIVVGAVFLDQILKLIIVFTKPNLNWGLLNITFTQNTGAGFGILQGQTIWLALISLTVATIIILNYDKIPKTKFVQLLFAFFLGGIVGNFIDRAFRGYVVDFINFQFWPAFNLADAFISMAVIGLIFYFWKK
jgi:signal peptidase II